jgi:hypothetical protein
MRTLSDECQVLTPAIIRTTNRDGQTANYSARDAPRLAAPVGKHADPVALMATEERGRQPYPVTH